MKTPLSLAILLLSSALSFAAGSREQSGPAPKITPTPGVSVTPPILQPLGVTPGLASSVRLPGAAAAAQPAQLPASAVPAQTQAAPAVPPSPPSGPNTSAAPPSGPPNGPHRAPEDGPQPGEPSALNQLKSELNALERRQKTADVQDQIESKKAELAAAQQAARAAYRTKKDELAALRRERDTAIAVARSAGKFGDEYKGKGGDAEARGRALDRAGELKARIAEKKHEIAVMERDYPALAGLRAPLVRAKNALGLFPLTAAEKKLYEEIKALEEKRDEKLDGAAAMFKLQQEQPKLDSAEDGMRLQQEANELQREITKKTAELDKLLGN